MCGRYAITLPPEAVRAYFAYLETPNFPPRFNVAPTQPIPIVLAEPHSGGSRRHFRLVRWGFLPGFVKDPKAFPLIINARAETLAEKASYRAALKRRRCLVIADGFYEWRKAPAGAGKRPYLIHRVGGEPMGFAGLYETWSDPTGGEIDTGLHRHHRGERACRTSARPDAGHSRAGPVFRLAMRPRLCDGAARRRRGAGSPPIGEPDLHDHLSVPRQSRPALRPAADGQHKSKRVPRAARHAGGPAGCPCPQTRLRSHPSREPPNWPTCGKDASDLSGRGRAGRPLADAAFFYLTSSTHVGSPASTSIFETRDLA